MSRHSKSDKGKIDDTAIYDFKIDFSFFYFCDETWKNLKASMMNIFVKKLLNMRELSIVKFVY